MTCQYCQDLSRYIVASNKLARVVRIGLGSSNRRVVIVPVRHVASWFETSTEEKLAILALVDQVQEDSDQQGEPVGYNINFEIGPSVEHLHLHVVPRSAAGREIRACEVQMAQSRLSTGGVADPFLTHLEPLFADASEISILAAFVQDSGVYELQNQLRSCMERGTRVRILTGDYLNLTQARALRHLLDLVRGEQIGKEAKTEGDDALDRGAVDLLTVRVVEMERLAREKVGSTFHPKAWIFSSERFGLAFVGSSNISRAALLDGVEWNLRLERERDPVGFQQILDSYEQLWSRGRALEDEWLEQYSQRARVVGRTIPAWEAEVEQDQVFAPWDIQAEALQMLRHGREHEHRDRGLVVLATGLGKTWLAVFDVNQFAEEHDRSPRVLFERSALRAQTRLPHSGVKKYGRTPSRSSAIP